jgi:hypothetical protein
LTSINSFGKIKNCVVEGNVITKFSAGIACSNFNGVIKNCGFIGDVIGYSSGGIVGGGGGYKNELLIKNCFMRGNIKGQYAGGLCGAYLGLEGKVKVKQSFCQILNFGSSCGGLIGRRCGENGYVKISNCYVIIVNYSHKVYSGAICGLQAGFNGRCKIVNSYSYLKNNEKIGGICAPDAYNVEIIGCVYLGSKYPLIGNNIKGNIKIIDTKNDKNKLLSFDEEIWSTDNVLPHLISFQNNWINYDMFDDLPEISLSNQIRKMKPQKKLQRNSSSKLLFLSKSGLRN